MKVTPAGFAHMTHMLSVLANGKLMLALEGGYNVDAIVKSAHACVEVLVGDEPRGLQLTSASASATNAVQDVIRVQSRHWKCMGQAIEPTDGECLTGIARALQFSADRSFRFAELKSAGKVVPVSGASAFDLELPHPTRAHPCRSQNCSKHTASTSSTTNTNSSMSRSATRYWRSRIEISFCARKCGFTAARSRMLTLCVGRMSTKRTHYSSSCMICECLSFSSSGVLTRLPRQRLDQSQFPSRHTRCRSGTDIAGQLPRRYRSMQNTHASVSLTSSTRVARSSTGR